MNISWQLAAHEAAGARFQFVEAEHILCSLDKAISLDEKDSGLSSQDYLSLHKE